MVHDFGYSQLVYPLSQTALSQKPVSWKAVSQPVSKFKKDQLTIIPTSYSQLVCPLSQKALSQKPVS